MFDARVQAPDEVLRQGARIPAAVARRVREDPDALELRSYWNLAGWHPPRD